MTTRDLSFRAPPSLAIASGASTPNPGVAGAVVWSTTTSSLLAWNGSTWQPVAGSGAGVTISKQVIDFGTQWVDQKAFALTVPGATVGQAVVVSPSIEPVVLESVLAEEAAGAGIPAQPALGAQPVAPTSFASGATYAGVTGLIRRESGGGLSLSAQGTGAASIDAGAVYVTHRFTITRLADCSNFSLNISGESANNTLFPTQANGNGYTLTLARQGSTATPFDLYVRRNDGRIAGGSPTIYNVGGAFPAGVTQFVIDVTVYSTKIGFSIVPTGAGSTTAFQVSDATYRYSFVGVELATAAGATTSPLVQIKYGVSSESTDADEFEFDPIHCAGRVVSTDTVEVIAGSIDPVVGRRYISLMIG